MRIFLTMLAPILWGTTYIVTTELLPDNRPLLVATARALPIGLLFVAFNRTLPKGVWWWRSFVLGILNIGLFFSLLFMATYRVPGGIVATVGAFQPLIVLALSAVVLSKAVPKEAIFLGGMGVVGVGLLVLSAEIKLDLIGILTAIAAAVSMAVGVVLTKKWQRPVSLATFTGWQLTCGGLFLGILTLIFERQPFEPLTITNVGGFLWLGLINTGLAYALWFRGIEQLTVWQVSFLGLLSPVVAMLAGYVILEESLTALQMAGMILIFSSVMMVQRVNRKEVANGQTKINRYKHQIHSKAVKW